MNVLPKVGQRVIYRDSSWHFICEVIEVPGRYKVIQHYYGNLNVGYVGASSSSFKGDVWTYLEGQDRPE